MSDNVIRSFGYAAHEEDKDALNHFGLDPDAVMSATKDAYPSFDPYTDAWLNRQDQGHMGSCQGHALSHVFQVMLEQRYGLQAVFSRMCCYIKSQRVNNIHGDHGSTLHGGQQAAMDGICLEHEWPYPRHYTTQVPTSAANTQNITAQSSKEMKDVDQIFEALKVGCAVQTGVTWNDSFEHKVSDRYRRGGHGGHSTVLYGINPDTGNAIQWNSWHNWLGDGRSEWSKSFLAGILHYDRSSVFITYDSVGLYVPDNIIQRVKAQSGE